MYSNFLFAWTRFVTENAKGVLAVIALLTLAAGWVAVTRFDINSDTDRLIRQDTDWRKRQDAFLETFPQYRDLTFVVVSGPSPSAVNGVAAELEKHLRADMTYFESVYAPGNSDFLDRHSLLFLSPDQLDRLISNLAEAQPILGSIARDPNLRGLTELLATALERDQPVPEGMADMTRLLADSAQALLRGDRAPAAWRDRFMNAPEDETFYNIIFVRGKKNFGDSLPAASIIESIESAIARVDHPRRNQVDIRLTGRVPLDHSEINSAIEGAQFAGTLALILLIIVLVFGVKSLRVIGAIYLSMIVGLIWTAAYATMSVGQYNTISIVFLVMFIGLGVDFAIHFCLRYQESLARLPRDLALVRTGVDIGPAISLCALTSAIGFLSFVPTAYTGLAELGIISGGGMLIALVLSLTIIPAFFALVKEPIRLDERVWVASAATFIERHRYKITIFTGILAIATFAIGKNAWFDYSTLALKNPDSAAMKTFRELQRENIVTDYALRYVAPDMQAAREAKAALMKLDTVEDARIPADYVPDQQEEKLFLLEDAGYMLAPVFMAEPKDANLTDEARVDAIRRLNDAIDSWLASNSSNSGLRPSLERLQSALGELLARDNRAELARQYESKVVDPLLEELDWLEGALGAGRIEFSDLPADMRDRLMTADDRVLVHITPSRDLVSVEALEEFATDVTGVVEQATGRPVVELGIGKIVIRALVTAIGIAVVAIGITLLITLRSLVDTILVFIPLGLATLLTLATSVVAGLPLNMANVVVIPLIFGLGVDNGIHVVKRYHEAPAIGDLVTSSTPRAVFLSTLTTLGTFGALSFSPHQGIFSIGVLLSCALSYLLVLTLFVLPALLGVFSPGKHPDQPA